MSYEPYYCALEFTVTWHEYECMTSATLLL